MEVKDLKDVFAILSDHSVGETDRRINPHKISKVLERDKKFAFTFRLNLSAAKDVPEKFDAAKNVKSRIVDAINELVKYTPKFDKKWSNPWWNEDVDTPEINRFGAFHEFI